VSWVGTSDGSQAVRYGNIILAGIRLALHPASLDAHAGALT
jgi:hypothetical protein